MKACIIIMGKINKLTTLDFSFLDPMKLQVHELIIFLSNIATSYGTSIFLNIKSKMHKLSLLMLSFACLLDNKYDCDRKFNHWR